MGPVSISATLFFKTRDLKTAPSAEAQLHGRGGHHLPSPFPYNLKRPHRRANRPSYPISRVRHPHLVYCIPRSAASRGSSCRAVPCGFRPAKRTYVRAACETSGQPRRDVRARFCERTRTWRRPAWMTVFQEIRRETAAHAPNPRASHGGALLCKGVHILFDTGSLYYGSIGWNWTSARSLLSECYPHGAGTAHDADRKTDSTVLFAHPSRDLSTCPLVVAASCFV